MLKAAVIAIYALISAYGLYRIKAATEIVSFGFLIGCILYGSGFLIWIYILRILPLSVAFPLAAGSLLIATQLFGVLLLKEPVPIAHVAGVVLILIGVGLVYQQA